MSFQRCEVNKFGIFIELVLAYLTENKKPSSIQINILFGNGVGMFSGILKIY
jgi:hypothetical protein